MALTETRGPVSRVARVARAVERALGVGAVGVGVAIVGAEQTLIDVWKRERGLCLDIVSGLFCSCWLTNLCQIVSMGKKKIRWELITEIL